MPSRNVGPSRAYGGGGGGVAVNGKMPDVTSKYAGVGFGGGSADEYSSSGYPLQTTSRPLLQPLKYHL